MVVCAGELRAPATPDALRERMANVYLDERQVSHGGCPRIEPQQRRWFNVGSASAAEAVERWFQEQRVLAGLRELRDAKPIDLRLKQALTGGDV